MNEKRKKTNHFKFYSEYLSTYIPNQNNNLAKDNLIRFSNSKNKNSNIIIYSDKNSNIFGANNKEIITENKNMNKLYNKNNKNKAYIVDNFNKKQNTMNNSFNINNINLINSMNSITFFDTKPDNKINIKKNNNITVNKKRIFNSNKNKFDKTNNQSKDNNLKNFGINFAIKGLKQSNNNISVNNKIKEKENNNIYKIKKNGDTKHNDNSTNQNSNMINVNKKKEIRDLNNLKFTHNSTLDMLSLFSPSSKNNNNFSNNNSLLLPKKNNLLMDSSSPKNNNSYIKQPKSENKNHKKFKGSNSLNKKFKKKPNFNINTSNPDDELNNIFISGSKTNIFHNYYKNFFSESKSENKMNNKSNIKGKNNYSNIPNLYIRSNILNKDSINLNCSIPKIVQEDINNNKSFEKIEVHKKIFTNDFLFQPKIKKSRETRNDSFKSFLERTHQNSWTNSKEIINSFSYIDNFINKDKNKKEKCNQKMKNSPKQISSEMIYNKKQLSFHNKRKSFGNFGKIVPMYNENQNENYFGSENLDELFNDNNSKDNNLDLNEFTYQKKIILNNIYKKPDKGFINNSFLLLGKDALINRNNMNKNSNKIKQYSNIIFKKENQKINRFLQRNEFINSKDINELSVLLISENNNNSKEITMDTNKILNEMSVINKINNKIINNNNIIVKYYSYFVHRKNNYAKQPCFISKLRIGRNNLKLNKIPLKNIYYISKERKVILYQIPKFDTCYFRKEMIYNKDDFNGLIKPILTERTSYNKKGNYNNIIISTTKRLVNIKKYDNNSKNKNTLKKTEKGLKLLEKIAGNRISLSSLLNKKNKKFFVYNNQNKTIKNDFIENLNIITINNYEIILNNISNLILSINNNNKLSNINISEIIKNQNDFIEVLISKGKKEKKYFDIYAKLCKDLFINLITIIDNNNYDNDLFDKITKEKSIKNIIKSKIIFELENNDNRLRDIFYFICELLENKVFSIKTGFIILDLLFKRYTNDLNYIDLEGIEILLVKMKKIIYEKNNFEHIQRYNKYIKNNLFNIFQKSSKSNDLPKYLYYRIYNLLQNYNNKIVIINKAENINNTILEMIKYDLEQMNIINESNIDLFLSRLNDKYDLELNKNNSIEIWEFFYYYVEVCIDVINSENSIKLANKYINNFINNFVLTISNEIWEILHYKLISLYLNISDICVDNIYMHQIMGYLLYSLINNKLFYIKDLNNFLEKENSVIVNISKVVKYTITFAEKNAKKFHNDFKQTKLFYGNKNFYEFVTMPLKKSFYEI